MLQGALAWNPIPMTRLSRSLMQDNIRAVARELYTDGPALLRAHQQYRPYICPFDVLIEAVPPDSFVLDIGCGGGLFLGLLSRTGRIKGGVGIDSNARAVDFAELMTNNLPPSHRVEFVVCDALESLPTGRYEVVTLLDVMHHVPPARQRQLLQDAIARVAAGGLLIYKDMARKPFWRALANRMHDLVLAQQWINYAPIEQVVEWAEASGCVVRARHAVNMLWYGHEIVVFECPADARTQQVTAH